MHIRIHTLDKLTYTHTRVYIYLHLIGAPCQYMAIQRLANYYTTSNVDEAMLNVCQKCFESSIGEVKIINEADPNYTMSKDKFTKKINDHVEYERWVR